MKKPVGISFITSPRSRLVDAWHRPPSVAPRYLDTALTDRNYGPDPVAAQPSTGADAGRGRSGALAPSSDFATLVERVVAIIEEARSRAHPQQRDGALVLAHRSRDRRPETLHIRSGVSHPTLRASCSKGDRATLAPMTIAPDGTLQLANGRSLRLTRFSQHHIYAEVVEGVPCALVNRRTIDTQRQNAARTDGHAPLLIEPTPTLLPNPRGDTGDFELTVIWFQEYVCSRSCQPACMSDTVPNRASSTCAPICALSNTEAFAPMALSARIEPIFVGVDTSRRPV